MSENIQHTNIKEYAIAIKEYNKAVTHDDNEAVLHSQAYNYSRDTSNITLRNTHGPKLHHTSPSYNSNCEERSIFECMDVYEEEPVVRNIIDLMSDFGSQGVRIICADKKQEQFGREWFRFVQGPERCERFLNLLYRCGTVVVKWTDGKVPLKIQKKWRSTTSDVNNGPKTETVQFKEIDNGNAVMPLKWIFHDPRQVVMIGGSLATFVGKPIFALRLNPQLRVELARLDSATESQTELQQFKKLIPDYIWEALNKKAQFFPLDQSKIGAYYYKKDDWDLWGKPLTKPILKDIRQLNKLKACDSAALDGALTTVRVWNVGSLEHNIIPNKPALDKVRNMLANITPGGVADIVWGPDLKMTESNSSLYQWLTPEKYSSTYSSIYAGLGVPPGLTGSSGSSSFTNNNISLKTLIERLKYGRTILLQFLNEQLELVRKAMKFTKKFEIEFDQMVLSDEAAEKALLLQLWDREVIDDEALRFAFDMDYSNITEQKINRANRRRGKSLPTKASPYHNPEKEHELKKLAIQKGGVTPSQIGLDLPEKKPGEKTFLESSTPKDKAKKPIGSKLTGRPINSKDGVQRKKRRVLPKGTSAEFKDLFKYAELSQTKIESIITPLYLTVANKKNVRSLSNEETKTLEALKIRIFSNIEPYSNISEDCIIEMGTANLALDSEFYELYMNNVYTVMSKYGRELNVNEKRNIICETFAEYFSE